MSAAPNMTRPPQVVPAHLDLERLPLAWGIEPPFRLRAPARGVSRLTRFVDTPGKSYVLSVYGEGTQIERVRYEHALLTALAGQRLPFAVPLPVTTPTGET